jgi:hypothetical protein
MCVMMPSAPNDPDIMCVPTLREQLLGVLQARRLSRRQRHPDGEDRAERLRQILRSWADLLPANPYLKAVCGQGPGKVVN